MKNIIESIEILKKYFLITLCLVVVLSEQKVLVTTKNGKIEGIIEKSRNDADFYSFRGIRYAKPPIGPRRFKPGEPLEPWSGTMDATQDGPICPQEWKGNKSILSEDCLVLNVYTKCLETPKPVMVYIHGGSFVSLSGHSEYSTGPQYLMDKDIVLVTINYRLGLFGFITTDTPEAPGNLAFKDQNLALRWVKENIANFGGDPNAITIFGQSAGGISVTLHLVSPMSQGLFQRALIMSGSLTTRIPALNTIQTKKIAQLLECNTENASEMIECLRNVDFPKILEVSENLNEFGNNPIRKWNYVVEKDFGQIRFLEQDPNILMSQGQFQRVPIAIGVTSKEFAYRAYGVFGNSTLLSKFNTNFEKYAPICLLYERNSTKSLEVSQRLKEVYFEGKPITTENFNRMVQLFGDGIVRSGLKRFTDQVRRHQNIYFYTNSFVGRFSRFYYPDDKPYGMDHADDLMYLFVNAEMPKFMTTDPENYMVEKLTGLWTHFAHHGQFSCDNTNTNEVCDDRWKPSNASVDFIYEISEKLPAKHEDFLNRLSVWNELFPEQNDF